jgi:hypothetical protein
MQTEGFKFLCAMTGLGGAQMLPPRPRCSGWMSAAARHGRPVQVRVTVGHGGLTELGYATVTGTPVGVGRGQVGWPWGPGPDGCLFWTAEINFRK